MKTILMSPTVDSQQQSMAICLQKPLRGNDDGKTANLSSQPDKRMILFLQAGLHRLLRVTSALLTSGTAANAYADEELATSFPKKIISF